MGKKKNIIKNLSEDEHRDLVMKCLDNGYAPNTENMLRAYYNELDDEEPDDDYDDAYKYMEDLIRERNNPNEENKAVTNDVVANVKTPMEKLREIKITREKTVFNLLRLSDGVKTVTIDLATLFTDESIEFSDENVSEYVQMRLRDILPNFYPSAFLPTDNIPKKLVHVDEIDDSKFVMFELETNESERMIAGYYISEESYNTLIETAHELNKCSMFKSFLEALEDLTDVPGASFAYVPREYLMTLILTTEYAKSTEMYIEAIVTDEDTVIDEDIEVKSIWGITSILPFGCHTALNDILSAFDDDSEDDDNDDFDDDDDDIDDFDDDDDGSEDDDNDSEDIEVNEDSKDTDNSENVEVESNETIVTNVKPNETVISTKEESVVTIKSNEPEEVDADDLFNEELPDESFSIGSRPAPKMHKAKNQNNSFIIQRQ